MTTHHFEPLIQLCEQLTNDERELYDTFVMAGHYCEIMERGQESSPPGASYVAPLSLSEQMLTMLESAFRRFGARFDEAAANEGTPENHAFGVMAMGFSEAEKHARHQLEIAREHSREVVEKAWMLSRQRRIRALN